MIIVISGMWLAVLKKTNEKVWVTDPDNAPWEIYTVLDDSATFSRTQPDVPTSVCATC